MRRHSEHFAAQWREALEEGSDLLEAEARRHLIGHLRLHGRRLVASEMGRPLAGMDSTTNSANGKLLVSRVVPLM